MTPASDGTCALCARHVPLTFHHLIPRRNHRKKSFRERFGLEEMRRRGLWLCRLCHDAVHTHFDEVTLGTRLNTLEALQAEPVLQRHVQWARRQKRGLAS